MNGDILKKLQAIDLSWAGRLRKEFVGIAVLIAFSFFFYRFVYISNVKEASLADARIGSLNAEIVRLKNETQAAENLGRAVEEASVNLTLLNERLKNLKQRLPSDKHVSRLLAEFSDSNARKGLRILSIKPLQPEDKGELARLPFQISMETRFISFGDYLERIEKLPRLMIVDNFLIEQKEGTLELTTQLYLSAYILSYGR